MCACVCQQDGRAVGEGNARWEQLKNKYECWHAYLEDG